MAALDSVKKCLASDEMFSCSFNVISNGPVMKYVLPVLAASALALLELGLAHSWQRAGAKAEVIVYSAWMYCAAGVATHLSDRLFSALLTFSSGLLCLAFAQLLIATYRGCTGFSMRTLILFALSICFRLTSTLRFNGYLPIDRTGDYIYQTLDIVALTLALVALFFVAKKPAPDDNFPAQWLVFACICLASRYHADLNNDAYSDFMWLVGHLLEMVAFFPQLALNVKRRAVDARQLHYFLPVAASGALVLPLRIECYNELKDTEGTLAPGNVIIGAQLVQIATFVAMAWLCRRRFS